MHVELCVGNNASPLIHSFHHDMLQVDAISAPGLLVGDEAKSDSRSCCLLTMTADDFSAIEAKHLDVSSFVGQGVPSNLVAHLRVAAVVLLTSEAAAVHQQFHFIAIRVYREV